MHTEQELPGIEKLRDNKYHLTPQRMSILRTLADAKCGEHLTAEDIYDTARKYYPQIGFATVYRTLDLFLSLSIIQRLILEDGKARFELKRDITHHHLICLSCGSVFEIDEKDPRISLSNKTDFQVTSSAVRYFGYCKKCYNKQ